MHAPSVSPPLVAALGVAIAIGGAGACRGTRVDAHVTETRRVFHCGAGEVASRSLGCVRVAQISGRETFCVLLTSGQVMCWGNNNLGELGDGTGRDSRTPVVVRGLVDAVEVAAPCARRRTGQVVCWGRNAFGQVEPDRRRVQPPWDLGRPGVDSVGEPPEYDILNVRPWPTTVRGIDDAVGIATGYRHSCAVRAGGAVVCWGDNSRGQLGTAAPAAPFVLQEVPGIPKAVEVAIGGLYTCVRTGEGSVWCWGGVGWDGELRDGQHRSTPRQVPGVHGAVGLELGLSNACARAADGGLTCWGDVCGAGRGGSAPAPIEAAGKIKRLAPGSGYASCLGWCAVRPGGEVDCNIPPNAEGAPDAGTTQRIDIGPAAAIVHNGNNFCALSLNGQVMCWRWLESGEGMSAPAPLEW